MMATGRTPRAWLHIAAAAMVLTGLNSIKPVHIDDCPTLTYAAEFAAHPSKPYAFDYGSPYLYPANKLLLPPLLPYWLGAQIRLFGDRPVLLKLGLFPFAILLAWAIDCLARRLTPTHRTQTLWLALLSPTILPGFNLMLDVPMLALGLGALAVVIRSIDIKSNGLVLVGGLLAGLAMQMKYNGIVLTAASVAWCILQRHPWRGCAVFAIAMLLFIGWECFIASTHGESHFLTQFRLKQGHVFDRDLHLVMPLFSQFGLLASAVALVGASALRWRRTAIWLYALLIVVGLSILALAPSGQPVVSFRSSRVTVTTTSLVYAIASIIGCWIIGQVCFRLVRRGRTNDQDNVLVVFLLVWLGLELCGYFLLSPYPAARRLDGLVLGSTFLVMRLAQVEQIAASITARLATFGVAFALLFYFTDLLEANAGQYAARQVAQRKVSLKDHGTFWYVSWWGFGYYAEREGLKPLHLNRELPRPGDLVAVEEALATRKALAAQKSITLVPIETVFVRDRWPFRTLPGYYVGRTPLDHQANGRNRVTIYRVDHVVRFVW